MRRYVGRGRGRRRVTKGKKDWVVGIWGEDTDQPVGPSSTQFYVLIDEQTLEDKDDKLTVLRIVGDLWTRPIAAGGGSYAGALKYGWGIKVFEVDNTGALLPQTVLDFQEADANWLFMRVGSVEYQIRQDTNPTPQVWTEVYETQHMYQNSGWGMHHIDVQVKRRMSANEVLILAMGAIGDNKFGARAATACEHAAFLRVLVGNL